MSLATPDAPYRVFVMKDGRRRVYRFVKADNHELLAGILERQLGAAR